MPSIVFRGPECLGNPDLKLDLSQLSPLLEKEMLAGVTDVFINERKQRFAEWIPNIITAEVKVRSFVETIEIYSMNFRIGTRLRKWNYLRTITMPRVCRVR